MPDPELLDGKYRIERELGRGSSGVVLEVTEVALDRRIALKIGPIEPAEMKARFLREGRAVAPLRSKHVAQVHRVGELADGRPYLAMDLLVGRTMAEAIATEGRIDPRRAIEWMLQALEPLAEAHAAGLVHRDLKPSNVYLVDRAGRSPMVKLIDFGMVKDPSDERITKTGDAFGTPAYVAPEQVADAARADARSDVWGAGVMLYQLLTGRLPFEGESVRGLLTAVATEAPSPMADVPPRLEAIVLKCLAKSPADRYADAGALARALEGVRPKNKKGRTTPALFVGSALGGMAAAGAVAFVLWPHADLHSLVGGAPHRSDLVVAASASDEPTLASSLEGAAPSTRHAAPRTPTTRISMTILTTSGGAEPEFQQWLSRVRPALEPCMRKSACLGVHSFLVTIRDEGKPNGGSQCEVSPAVLDCIDAALPRHRQFVSDQNGDATVTLYIR